MAPILDTGPLYAALDRRDADYQRGRGMIEETDELLVIPAPVLVGVDYWVRFRLYAGVMVALLDEIARGAFTVEELRTEDYQRVREVCDRYADSEIGFVDAAVLAVTERLGEPKLATLDHRHFGSLRPRHVTALRLLPIGRPT
jgi:uncharacterized protein